MTTPHNTRMRWLRRDGVGPAGSARHYTNSDSVRQWLVLRALSGDAEGQKAASQQALDMAFDRMAYGFKHELIELDYSPADGVTLDIPNIDDPTYLQAMVFWSVRMNCTLSTLSEAHALLGSHPSVKNTCRAVARLEHDAASDDRWAGTLQVGTDTPPTIAMFESTRAPSDN